MLHRAVYALPHPAPLKGAVLACGAWFKNSACLLDGATLQWPAEHGDLEQPAACAALAATVRDLAARAATRLRALAHDLHPDFFSTILAQQLAQQFGVPALAVQHHHAHVAAVVAEAGLDGPVLGLALDGVGLGNDGTAWGGELLGVEAGRCVRLGHLWPLRLPGGDVAARQPWRLAASALDALGQAQAIVPRLAPQVGEAAAQAVAQLLQRGLACPATSSAGRWFDAAAALLGLAPVQQREAEAARALQEAAQRALAREPDLRPDAAATLTAEGVLDLRPLLLPLRAVEGGDALARERAAAAFHLGLADALVAWVAAASARWPARAVVLGGGCWANALLRARVTRGLRAQGWDVHMAQWRGPGDAGLALGQAWVAAHVLATAEAPGAVAVVQEDA
ncbi:MAG: carbamoyltransferase HypF [Tepidimonas sp.]|uniref:Kae1-like domain-containing protein n=1 Tax=Tepidimonas sp. TaxID=2002775 RepID=UPI00298EDCA0|nr:carbamoyltransferase HypF [Tepidimonas sp.]MDW8335431.1 carbamoyltransferase HypF [Tepidimonas sp.]